MRRRLTAGAISALLLVPAGQAVAGNQQAGSEEPPAPPGPVVLAEGLNNPRQLSWSTDGERLVVAEAGRGALSPEDCVEIPLPPEAPEDAEPGLDCQGPTGSVSVIDGVRGETPATERVIEGLPSSAAPDGQFAVGTNGVTQLPEGESENVFAVAQSPGLRAPDEGGGGEEEFREAPDTDQGAYLVADVASLPPDEETPPFPVTVLPGGDIAALASDLDEAETTQNPGGGTINSNPYAVVFVTEDPAVEEDGFALVADAGANVVWKIEPLEEGEVPEGGTVNEEFNLVTTVFHSFGDRPLPGPEVDTEEEFEEFFRTAPPEFVPTSLALTHDGHVVVGGLGSDREGEAEVVEFDLATGDEVQRWSGFTAVTGVAVDDEHVYVSQLFGDTPPGPPGDSPDDEAPPMLTEAPGSVVRVSRDDPEGPRAQFPAPLPAGLAADGEGGVYAAVNSTSPAEGVEDVFGPDSFDLEGGQVWHVGAELFAEEPELVWPPADTAGEFVEFPDEFLPVHVGELCGSEVTVEPGDVREVEYRSTVAGGTTVVEIRGRSTVDVRRASDDAFIDELDVSGTGTEVYAPGRTLVLSYEGPSIVVAPDDVVADALEEAGLPAGFYFAGGRLTGTAILPALETPPGPQDPAPAVEFAVITENTTEGVRDLCDMLDEAGPGGEEPVQPGRVTAVDTTAKRITLASGAVVLYDANDDLFVDGEEATLEEFEAALSAGLVLIGVQELDPADPSWLELIGDVDGPDEART